MSTGRIHGVRHLQCDGPSCHEFIEADDRSESLEALWCRAQRRGWTMRDGLLDVAHFCRDCSKPFGGLKVVKGERE